MDINAKAIHYAAAQVQKAQFIRKSLLRYTGRKKYDYIGIFDVLEHQADDISFLRRCREHLKAGGLLFITVPAGKWLWSDLDQIVGHSRRYDPQELAEKLYQTGFSVIDWNYWQVFTLPVYWLWRSLMAFKKKRSELVGFYLRPPIPIINTILFWLLVVEQQVGRLMRYRAGASLIMVARKK